MISELSHRLYTMAQSRELERLAEARAGLCADELMRRAGEAAFDALLRCWPGVRRVGVVCGGGNNGGDGFVVARLAKERGLEVFVRFIGEASCLPTPAAQAFAALQKAGVAFVPEGDGALLGADVIVDALFGTGLTRAVSGRHAEAIDAMNACGKPILALDVPSGLCSDTGRVLGHAVRAALTVSFVGHKRGLFTGDGPDHAGERVLSDLGVPREVYDAVSADAGLLDFSRELNFLPRRRCNVHKGDFGHALIAGGDVGLSGAPRLAAEAALRVGSGLVSVATRAAHAAVLNVMRPEIMCRGIAKFEDLTASLERATVVAVGPGLGAGGWSRMVWKAVLASHAPLVVDADALNLLARFKIKRDNWVLTPHPGEAARLLGSSVVAVQADRFAAVRALREIFGGVVVLKGCGTLVADEDGVAVCCDGNPGMASGGMGDALTGVIAGLIAQDLALSRAARLGVCLHARAGDLAAAQAPRGLVASDLMPYLRELVNPREGL